MKKLILPLLTSMLVGCFQASKTTAILETNPSTKDYEGLGRESISEDELKSFAPRDLAPEVSRQLERMLEIRETGRGIPSNDGQTLYFTWTVTGRPQVWKTSRQEHFPSQLTGGEDSTLLNALTPDDQFLVVSRDQKGEENPGLYLLSVNGGKLSKIFQKSKVQAHFQLISPDSQFVYFSANDRSPEDRTLYRFHIPSKQTEKVFDEKGTWFIADMRNNDRLLLGKATGALSREYYEFDLNTKALTPVLGQGKSEDISISYGAKAGDFLVLTNMLGDLRRLYSFSGGSFSPLSVDSNFEVENFEIDQPRNRIAYAINENGWSKLNLVDAKTLKSLELPKISADQWSIGNFSSNGRYLTLGIESDGNPSSIYLYDFEKKALTKWINPQSPEIDTDGFAEATLETYPARDGTKIPILIRRPNVCEEPCPVILHFHGGPEGQSRPGFSAFAQIFVDAGFVFAEPNVRGSTGYGKEWVSSDDGAKRLNVITDIEDAALYFKNNFKKGDRSPKVGIMGYSYGGYSTLMGMTRFAENFDAGVALVGMSNLVSFLENTAPYRRRLRISEYGDPEKDRDALMKLSPISYVEQAKNPLLIIQGVSDPRVPVGEALQIYRKLKAKGLDVNLILLGDEGHGSMSRQNQVIELGNTLSFFQKNLK